MNTSGLHPTVIRTERGLTVDGTRLTLYTLIDHLKMGWPPKLIQDWFDLTDQQMNDVLTYIAAHQEEVEAEYRQVLERNAEDECYWREYNREYITHVAALPAKPDQAVIKAKLQAWKQTVGIA